MGLRFEHPELLSWLALLPVLLGIVWFGQWRRRRLLARFADPLQLERLTASVSMARRRVKTALLLAAYTLAIVAIARPQYGFMERKLPRKALDVMIAIDTSASMLSQDIKPTRLDRARDQLKALIRKLNGDRVGIIAFAGEAYLQCPLTTDYGIALQVLDTLSPGTVPIPGTAIGRAIELARENFEKNEQGKRVLVLLTDGEDQGSDPVKAAQEAAKANVIIDAIGIGSEEGAPIPMQGGVKKDSEGHAVNTRLDFNTLKAVAAATGGVAIKSRPAGFMELDRLAQEIESLQKRTLSETERMVYQERFQWFLLAAVLCLLAEMVMGERKRTTKSTQSTSLNARSVLLLSVILYSFATHASAFDWGDPVAGKTRQGNDLLQRGKVDEAIERYKQAQVDAPEKPELYYNLGVAMARQKKIDDAIKSFESAAKTDTANLKQNTAYNLGWSYLQKGIQAKEANDSQAAMQSFEKALQHNHEALKSAPTDKQAKHNYELTRQLLAELKKEQEQQKQEQNQQQEQKKEEEKKEEQKQQPQSQPQQNQQQQNEQQQDKATPTPTPSPTPGQEQQKQQDSQDQQSQQEQAKQGEQKPDNENPQQMEMKKASEEEAERILQQLDEEDARQFQRLFVPERIEQQRWVRDW